MCTTLDLVKRILKILHGEKEDDLSFWCKVKSTFSDTGLVPAMNDMLITNPSPAAVSRFYLGWLDELNLDVSNVH